MFSKPKLSWSFESLLWYSSDGSDTDSLFWIGSHFLLLRVRMTSFFFSLSLSFCLNCFFGDYIQRDAPVFVSLLPRFWLVGLFISRDNDCLSLWLYGTITVSCFRKTSLMPFCAPGSLSDALPCAPGLTERTTLPQVVIKGFNFCEKKTSYFFGSKGLARDYLPYDSSV